MQSNGGVVTIDEGNGVKSRPITSRFWLRGGRYRVTLPSEGWMHVTFGQCQIGEESKPMPGELGSAGKFFFRVSQGFYRFMFAAPVDEQPTSAEIMRVEA